MKRVVPINWNTITLTVLQLSCGHKKRLSHPYGKDIEPPEDIEAGWLIYCKFCKSNVQVARVVEIGQIELVTTWQVLER